jgi:hypothetical protein
MLNAFCRVAPSVRFRALAILAAGLFFFASVFRVRTCSVVHARRLDFLAIEITPVSNEKVRSCSIRQSKADIVNIGFGISGSLLNAALITIRAAT